MVALVSTIGFVGLLFGSRWLLATARLASLRSGRRRGGTRGHFLGAGDRRFADRVFFAVCAGGAAGSFLFGVRWAPWLAIALAGPAVVLVGAVLESQRARQLEAEALAVLEALRGLLRSGAMSPPGALARIGRVGKGQGAARLRSRLASLDDGESFEGALRRFARKLGDTPTGDTYRIMASASRAGLPLVPLLDRALPELRAEGLAREKLRAVRSRAVAQAAVASVIPWGLSALIAWSTREPLPSNTWVNAARGLAGVLEVGGLVLAWRMTCFR